MKTMSLMMTALLTGAVLAGCSKPDTTTPPEAATPAATPAPAAEPVAAEADAGDNLSEAGDQTFLEPIALAPFTTKVMHIGEVSKGHFNLYVDGGQPAAVRAWIGDEAATNVLITKAEFEVDHHCAHLEVTQPLPEGAKFWLELETADGKLLKGSSELK